MVLNLIFNFYLVVCGIPSTLPQKERTKDLNFPVPLLVPSHILCHSATAVGSAELQR